jgi:hypothetical protein
VAGPDASSTTNDSAWSASSSRTATMRRARSPSGMVSPPLQALQPSCSRAGRCQLPGPLGCTAVPSGGYGYLLSWPRIAPAA